MGKKNIPSIILVILCLVMLMGGHTKVEAGHESPFTVDTIRIHDFYRDARFARIVDTELQMICYFADGATSALECFRQGEE